MALSSHWTMVLLTTPYLTVFNGGKGRDESVDGDCERQRQRLQPAKSGSSVKKSACQKAAARSLR
jgi:hypothetical protein